MANKHIDVRGALLVYPLSLLRQISEAISADATRRCRAPTPRSEAAARLTAPAAARYVCSVTTTIACGQLAPLPYPHA